MDHSTEPIVLRRWEKHPYWFINGKLEDRIAKMIARSLSYFVQGYERTDKYKTGRWNGMDCLLYQSKAGAYYFPSGLLKQVVAVLDAYHTQYTVEKFDPSDILERYRPVGLEWHGPPLRPYQLRAINDIIIREGGVISLPTGGGKTLIAMKVMHYYDLPTLIVVHRRELLKQWKENIEKVLGYTPALYGSGYKQRFEYVTIGLMQSLIKYKHEIDFPVLISDECHHCPADTLYTIAMQCNAPIRIGLSATPRREQGDELKIFAAMGNISSNVTPVDLIKAGFLAKPKFVFLTAPAANLPRRVQWQQAYMDGIVTNRGRNDLIISTAEKIMKENLSVYVHVEYIDHGEFLAERIRGARFVCGTTPKRERDALIKRFSEGDIKCLVSTLLGEGVDIPAIDAIIMAGARKTTVGTIQKIGRALRIRDDKDEALVIDFRDSGKYLGQHWEGRYRAYKEYYGDYVP